MTIQEHIPLAPYTTFRIGGPARFFCCVRSQEDIVEAVTFAREQTVSVLVLGGGSNMLICDDGYPGLVIKNEIRGIEVSADGADDIVKVAAGAGESWDGVVAYAVAQGLYGIENLSAIPGTVGAAPVQNIGAYGMDVSQSIISVRAFDMRELKLVEFSNAECQFGYRDSIFKKQRGRYVIISVVFKLKKSGTLKTDYKDVVEYLAARNIVQPTLAELRAAIVEIRAKKLPDWTTWGTAGSFFKNPSIPAAQFDELKKRYPELPGFSEPDGKVKVSLGWIIDKICDARGLMIGNAGTYEKQALVIVTKPGASSSDVLALVRELMKRVKDKTGIDIEGEVEWVC